MVRYYMITKRLTFYVDVLEGQSFLQEVAENLMDDRNFGCCDYCFTITKQDAVSQINLTCYYDRYLEEYYKD